MKKRLFSFIVGIMTLLMILSFPVLSSQNVAAFGSEDAETAAQSLYQLGLFQGAGTDASGTPDFALDRAPTRNEAVTMLVRLLGKETEAKSQTWSTPYTDVAEWAAPYVGYAYTNGLISGTSDTTYSGESITTASQYLTFVLRALGYSSDTDFQWDNAWELSDRLGITHGEYGAASDFTRGDIAIISSNALYATVKDGDMTLLASIQGQTEGTTNISTPSFEVHFIDVGQADAALVLCDGTAMLIDGGNAEDSSLIYSYLRDHAVDHLNYIVNTHPHEDHVGGLAGALNYATVDVAYAPVTAYDSRAFNSFVKYLDAQDVQITVPPAGDTFALGRAGVEVLGPVRTDVSDVNNLSIVLRITYGDTAFLFTGDAEREEEQDILAAGYSLKSDVLKVGHHGSNSSTSYPFLYEIMPRYAVISVGAGNSYGHPTESTLSRLRDADVTLYRTDLQGDVICVSDGTNVSFTVKKNADVDVFGGIGPNSTTVQPGRTQQSVPSPVPVPSAPVDGQTTPQTAAYILNTNTHKFHYPSCSCVSQMSTKIKCVFEGTREEIIAMGYDPCGRCHP